ncbi:MAG TPA: PD-(D/E)XK nuclease family protein, partial [Thermoguttaceae bacterium]|nr:PD-(D/E)XK nuclease family protein [Thermoguttaceae bacterium]
PTEPIERVCRYVGEKIRPILPHKFIETFDRDRRQRVEESLCLLYVAMTRAVNVLDMLVAPSKANESKFPATSAAILRAALAGTAPVEPGASLHEQGDPNCLNQTCATAGLPSSAVSATGFASGSPTSDKEGKTVLLTGGASGTQATEAITIHLAKPTHRLRRGLDRRSPSQLGGGPRVDLASRIHFDTNESRLRGTVIHAWFERIEWLDGDCPIQPGDCPNFRLSENGTVPFDGTIEAQLLALARQHTSDEAAVRRWLADFHAALSRPTIRAVFNHAQYVQHSKPGGEVRLWRERPFAIRQNDALLSGTIDRLVVCHENGKPTTADVLDFKSDHLPPDNPAAIAARVDFYRPQMQAYASAIAAMFHLPPERISTRLVFIDPGVVQDV